MPSSQFDFDQLMADIKNSPDYVKENLACYFYHNTHACNYCTKRDTCPSREPRKGDKGRFCVYPGSFDPFTFGHLDIVKRALKLFDGITILVCINSSKETRLITCTDTVSVIRKTIMELLPPEDSTRVKVDFLKLGSSVLDYMSNHRNELNHCMNIIRGVRNSADAEYEINLCGQYEYFSHNIKFEFIPLIASPEYRFLSSSIVREAWKIGCLNEVAPMVPEQIEEALYNN